MHPLFDLTGRVAVVSGAGRNMGRASALALAEVGADLLICDLDDESLEGTAAAIRELGRHAVARVCDVSDREQILAFFGCLDREFGQIDVLVNIPGLNLLCHPEDIALDQLMEVLRSSLIGKLCCCQEAGRRMLKAGRGSIINMSSIAGLSALGRGNLAYSIGQAGVIQMTRELSTEWAGRGVRVNAIAPAQIHNEAWEQRLQAEPSLRDTVLRGIPMGRFGVPDDVKGLVIFLAADASAFVTGAVLPLDGGNLAMNANGTCLR